MNVNLSSSEQPGTSSPKERKPIRLTLVRNKKPDFIKVNMTAFTDSPQKESREDGISGTESPSKETLVRTRSHLSAAPTDPRAPFAGLINAGNTCYINSCLQILYFCPGFVEQAETLSHRLPRESTDATKALHQLVSIFQQMRACSNKPDATAINPKEFLSSISTIESKFCAQGQQQDAQEFIHFLLDMISQAMNASSEASITTSSQNNTENSTPLVPEDSDSKMDISTASSDPMAADETPNEDTGDNNIKKRKRDSIDSINIEHTPKRPKTETNFLNALFGGKLSSYIRCLECEKNTVSRNEPFLDLSVNIEKGKPLTWSLQQLTYRTRLRGEDKYRCETCHSLTEAVQEVRFSGLPTILCIQLKRFKWSSFRLEKISDAIDIPLTFSVDPESLVSNLTPYRYELFGVIFHKGASPFLGHYVAFVKEAWASQEASPNSTKWIRFDDDVVTYCEESDFMQLLAPPTSTSTTPYILFYSRIGQAPVTEPKTPPIDSLESMDVQM